MRFNSLSAKAGLACSLFLCALPLLAAPGSYQVKTEKIERKQGKVEIHVALPILAGAPTAAMQSFNSWSRGEAQKDIKEFRKQVAEVDKDAPQTSSLGRSYNSGFTVKHQTPKLLALVFTGDEYLGGAHPAPFVYSRFFDPRTGKKLALKQLFKGPNYLQVLSRESKAELQKDENLAGEAKWLSDGTAPKDSNFTAVYPDKDGIHVIFPAYQVAPYAAGTPEVTIGYDKFAGELNPEYLDAP